MPLKINSEHKSVIIYLRNFEIIEKILQKLNPNCSEKDNSLEDRDKLYEIISKMYSADYDLENEDAADIIVYKYKKNIIEIFKDVANKLFLVDNGKVFLKSDRLADYNIYATSLDIYPFFAQYLLEKSGDLAYKDSLNQANYLIAYADETFRFYGNMENKIDTISDMHIHLGASLDFHYRIHDILTFPKNQVYDFPQEIYIHLYKEVSTVHFYMAFSILENIIFHMLLNIDVDIQLYKLTQLIKKMDSKYFFTKEDVQDLEEIMSEISSVRLYPQRFKNYYFSDEVNNVLFTKIKNYFDKDSEEYEVKYGDKLLIILFMRILNEINTNINLSYEQKKLKNLIWLYFVFRNITKLLLVQQHRREGFGYFESYANNKFYKKGKQSLKTYRRLKSILHSRLKTNIEGRTTIEYIKQDGIFKSALKTKETIIEYINSLEKIKKQTKIKHNLRLFYHFIKLQDKDDKEMIKILNRENIDSIYIEKAIKDRIRSPKYSSLRMHYKAEAMVLNQLFVNPTCRFTKKSNIFHDKSFEDESHSKIDLFKEYIAGIDAANKEYLTPPEVFSAVYSFFKNSITSSGLIVEQNRDGCIDPAGLNEVNLQYSFHVGEEYRDIMSGLRAIFEAVVFLNLKDEDRIGHAVALGISPKLFLSNRKYITLPIGEYLDNLLFLYFFLNQRDDSPISLEMIKNRIYRVASEIYNHNFEDKSFKIDDYIEAWLLRRNCPNELENLLTLIKDDEDLLLLIKDTAKSSDLQIKLKKVRKNKYSKVLFLKELISVIPNILDYLQIKKYDKIFIKNALPDFFNVLDNSLEPIKRYMKIKNNPSAFKLYEQYAFDPLITYRSKQIYNSNPSFEPNVYEMMQDLIMEDLIVKKNIIIEILPTSNILITSINSYENHHFLRLHPPKEIVPNKFGIRKGKIKLILGTDDPGIQGTNLMMEIYHIKNVLRKKYDKKTAEEYIIKMLEFGNYVFCKK